MSFKTRLERALPVWKHILKRTTPFVRMALASGGSAGDIAVTGILKGDQLVAVIESATTSAVLTSRTTEFIVGTTTGQIIAKDGYINNVGGTDTSSDNLLVLWIAWAEA